MSNHVQHELNTYGSGKKTLGSYLIGFGLSLGLTLMAFGLVGGRMLSNEHLYIALAILAVLQLIVQVIYFLRLNTNRWNAMSFLFTLLIVVILVAGTLWIMYNMHYNMMIMK